MNIEFDSKNLSQEYCDRLVQKILPFWLTHGMDKVNGGIYTGLDRDGSLIETDKSVWFQGRALWTFASASIFLKERSEKHGEDHKALIGECLEACASLVDFLEKHCTDPIDGRMYFRVTKDGKPVIKRLRYFFSETFAVVGYAAYARATNKKEYAQKALDMFRNVERIRNTPDLLVPKFNPETSPSRGFGVPMILLNTVSELRSCLTELLPNEATFCNGFIDELLAEIKTYFIRPELQVVLEQCAPDGTIQHDHLEGRQLNPGHAIEGAWFVMKEGLFRGDKELQKLGCTMLDWMWRWGWDDEYGGIIYFRDLDGKSSSDYWQDMKFWWPQNEAVIANLYAYKITGASQYKEHFALAHKYFHARFSDDEYGGCYGYFHRDGTLSTPLKGNMYKGPFHTPRMYLEGSQLLDDLT